MIDHDHDPLLRLIGLAVAGGGAAGLLHGLADRAVTVLLGTLASAVAAMVLEYIRPIVRRRGERLAQRLHGETSQSSRPPPEAP